MQKNAIVILTLVVIVIGGFFTYQYFDNATPAKNDTGNSSVQVPEGSPVIVETKDGFVPSEITIKKGETITFKSTTKNLFWPASNLHPSHLLYPEFDPKEPIQPDAVWSFTFGKSGKWQFHDHLAPYFTGTITVTE